MQYDPGSKVYWTDTVTLADCKVDVYNGYRWKTELYIEKCRIDLRYISFNEKFHMVAKYKINGVCRDAFFADKTYETAYCYGNPVIKMNAASAAQNKYSDDREDFSNDVIESFVYYQLGSFGTIEEMEQDYKKRKRRKAFFTGRELNWLFTDIPGEAG